VFLGSVTQVMVRLPHGPVIQALYKNAVTGEEPYEIGDAVTVCLPSNSLRVLAWSNREADEAAGVETAEAQAATA
jgi:hypothetical protein